MYTNKLNRFYFLLFLAILLSCNTNPDYSDIPEIEFVSFDKSMMDQGRLNNDSVYFSFKFTDGDGDIGAEPSDHTINIYITDNRTGNPYGQYKLPAIPKEGANNGVTGTIQMKLFTTCCIFPDNDPIPCTPSETYPTNVLSFDLYIIDRAGNKSNTITTSDLTLNCN